jgi:hypothetical protein
MDALLGSLFAADAAPSARGRRRTLGDWRKHRYFG